MEITLITIEAEYIALNQSMRDITPFMMLLKQYHSSLTFIFRSWKSFIKSLKIIIVELTLMINFFIETKTNCY